MTKQVCPIYNDKSITLTFSKEELEDLIHMAIGYIEEFEDYDEDKSNLINKLKSKLPL